MAVPYDFKKQRSFVPYPSDVLPEGFRYPERYLEHAREMLYPQHFTWSFIDFAEHGPQAWEVRLHWKDHGWSALADIDPIPFARNGDCAAFFDGHNKSGEPSVVVVDLGNKAYGIDFATFDAWLAATKMQCGVGEPPYDKVRSDPSYPKAVEAVGGYFLCPNCLEANRPAKDYDDAIRCESCGTLFNLR